MNERPNQLTPLLFPYATLSRIGSSRLGWPMYKTQWPRVPGVSNATHFLDVYNLNMFHYLMGRGG
jgi:hypothetical protein